VSTKNKVVDSLVLIREAFRGH